MRDADHTFRREDPSGALGHTDMRKGFDSLAVLVQPSG
jgi:hypothetical protein